MSQINFFTVLQEDIEKKMLKISIIGLQSSIVFYDNSFIQRWMYGLRNCIVYEMSRCQIGLMYVFTKKPTLN